MKWAALAAAAMLCACAQKGDLPRQIAGADPAHGLDLIQAVGCAACHAVPGIDWPRGSSGGSLSGFGRKPLIAGRLPNQPDVLIAWLRDPPALVPGTAMPPSPLTEAQARDVAAYLYTLDDR